MADWTAKWQDEMDQRVRGLVERAMIHLDDLRVRYDGLGEMLVPGRGDRVGGGRSSAGPSVPIRVDVVDLARDVERFSTRYAGLVAGSLRAGPPRKQTTVRLLAYVGDNLGPASLADPSLAADVEGGAAALRWRARHIAGEVAAAFAVDVDCPECGVPALWVHPGRGLVRCGMESCGSEWAVGEIAVPVWSARHDN